jgi:hypothetical protein
MLGATPAQLRLDRQEQAVECQRTRVITYADGSPPYKFGTTIIVKPTVGVVSTVMDTSTGYFMGDLEIVNANYCVDYANFPPCGAMQATINQLTIKNQGTTLEQIENYNIVANTLAVQKGSFDEVSTWYFSNKLALGYNETYHRNMVKPPMVDRSGKIMFGMNQFGLGFASDQTRQTMYLNNGLSFADGSIPGTGVPNGAIGSSLYNNNLSALAQVDKAAGAGYNIGYFAGTPSFISAVDEGVLPSWTVPSVFPTIGASGATFVDWPDLYVPNQSEIVYAYAKEYGSINKPMITQDLCNVRCFPIGMQPALNAYGTGSYGTLQDVDPSTQSAVASSSAVATNGVYLPMQYRVICRPISGMIGELDNHWLFTMLMTNGQLSFNVKLEQNAIALWLSSDPCRRLVGTCRDYIPNRGTQNGRIYGSTIYTVANDTNEYWQYDASEFAPGYSPLLCVPFIFNQLVGTSGSTPLPVKTGLNTHFSTAATCGQVSISTQISTGTSSGPIVSAQYCGVTNLPSVPQYMLVHRPWLYHSISGYASATTSSHQYFANETQMFYGTYLKASVPQSVGIMDLQYDGQLANLDSQVNKTYYQYQSFAWVCDNIAFPSEVTASIVEAARADRFIVDTLTVKNQQLTVQNAITQSININVTALEARKMYIIWQNQRQYSNASSIFYNSFCGLNPYASISRGVGATKAFTSVEGVGTGCYYNASQFTSDTDVQGVTATIKNPQYAKTDLTGVGDDIPPIYKPTSANVGSSTQFAWQMTIGATNYPLQEITSITETLAELMKCRERFDDSFYSPNLYATASVVSTQNGNTSGTTDLFYDCLTPDTFTTAFVPYELWDDQRITGNTDFAPLASFTTNQAAYNTPGNAGQLSNCGTTAVNAAARNSTINGYNWLAPRGFCCQGVFMHPSSNFMIGINFAAINMDSGLNSWTYLGTQTITFKMRGTVGLNVTGESYTAWCISIINARYKYGINGNMTFVSG